jgi:thiamine-phosphate pyrophosphorylase
VETSGTGLGAPTLYLVTPDGWPTAKLLPHCEQALAAGARWIQYRDKSVDPQRRIEQAKALLQLVRRQQAKLIINDDVELALACGADGVHLGEHDTELSPARQRLGPTAIIGVSCYDQLHRARTAAVAGASYLAFGAFFPSSTKPTARHADITLLAAARRLNLPLCAIGGITAARAQDLVQAGADIIAVVSAVFDDTDPAQATERFVKAMARGWALRNTTRQIAH